MGPKKAAFALVLAVAVPAGAQMPLRLPDVSPAATVRQVVGVTEIEVDFHRPAVNGRKIWGGQVPYDQVWRAGANENTVISFDTPVKIGAADLAAGRYGLHLLPTATGEWTVIFSRMADAWGSFSYDAAEDALRVAARPESAPFQERLGYSFDDLTANSVVLALRWEELRLPIPIAVDAKALGLAELRRQLRGLPRFGWVGWNQAANWSRQNGGDLEEAEGWADRSIGIQRNFTNLRTKSLIACARGRTAEAAELLSQAMSIATEAEINQLGYQHLAAGAVDEAIATFRKNVADHPDSWNTYDSLGEGLATKGNKAEAIRNYEKALSMVTDEAQKERIRGVLAGLRG